MPKYTVTFTDKYVTYVHMTATIEADSIEEAKQKALDLDILDANIVAEFPDEFIGRSVIKIEEETSQED